MNTNSDLEMTLGTTAPRGPGKTLKRRSRVLIAEDDWAFRDMLLFAFEEEGCEVVAVGDGASLLQVLASSMLPKSDVKPFDLVVSDVRMPGWNGLPALEKLSQDPKVPPVVVITAFGSEEVHARAAASPSLIPISFRRRLMMGNRRRQQRNLPCRFCCRFGASFSSDLATGSRAVARIALFTLQRAAPINASKQSDM